MTTASLWAPGTTDIPSQNSNSSFVKQQFTATASQTLFTLTDFVYVLGTNSLLVFDNGVMLIQGVDFTETSTASFTLATGATVGHKITAYGLVEVSAMVNTPGAGTVDTASLASSLLVPIGKGGTGQITAPLALAALGGVALTDNNAWTGTQTFLDNKFQIKDNLDTTKIVEFQASGLTPATTRTLAFPDQSGTLATLADITTGNPGFSRIAVLTGTGNWTVPSGVTTCKVTVVGGGGNGGTATGGSNGGAGGGGGGTAIKICSGLTPLSTIAYVVGGAATGSSFADPAGSVTASAGTSASGSTLGAGGIGSGGDLNIKGSSGSGVDTGLSSLQGGDGGGSFLGGSVSTTAFNTTGTAGAAYGGGGSGGGGSGASNAGGAGAAGTVFVEY